MKEVWKEVCLGDVCEISSSKRIYASDYVEKGIPFYRSKEIIEAFNGKKISLALFIDVNKYKKIKDKYGVPEVNDILLTSVGTIGIPFIVKNAKPFYFKDGNLIWLKTSKALSSVDPKFLYSFITSDFGKGKLDSILIGSSQKALTISGLNNLKITLPPLPTQKKIANILSAYDALIENNIKRIELLEEKAQLIYEEWFVRMRFPNHENTQIDAETGLPEGWSHKQLNEIADLIKASIHPDSISSDTPYIGLEHIPRKSITLSKWETSQKVDSLKFQYQKGDVLFGKIRPYFHKVGIALNSGVTSTDTIVLRAKNLLMQGLLLNVVFSNHFVDSATQSSNGTKMPRANWAVLKKYPVIAPSEEVIEQYDDIFKSIIKELENLVDQNALLKEAQDILLPRLMMGLIEV